MVCTGPVSSDSERALCKAWFEPALTDDDRAWLRRHLELADVRIPTVDISWLDTDTLVY